MCIINQQRMSLVFRSTGTARAARLPIVGAPIRILISDPRSQNPYTYQAVNSEGLVSAEDILICCSDDD